MTEKKFLKLLPKLATPIEDAVKNIPREPFAQWHTRIVNVCRKKKIYLLWEIATREEQEFFLAKGIGANSLDILRKLLKANGLKFEMEFTKKQRQILHGFCIIFEARSLIRQ